MFTCQPVNLDTDTQFHLDYACAAHALSSYTLRQYGKRCGDYEPGCACCRAWRIVDDFTDLND